MQTHITCTKMIFHKFVHSFANTASQTVLLNYRAKKNFPKFRTLCASRHDVYGIADVSIRLCVRITRIFFCLLIKARRYRMLKCDQRNTRA